MKKKFLFVIALMALMPLALTSCSNDKNYPYIGENGNWFVNNKDTGVPATGPAGQDGTDGEDGTDGVNGQDGANGNSPTIGENGNWWLGNTDTGIPATGAAGENGTNGETPFIGQNGNWWIGEVDTGIPAEGKTPEITIGSNGNWFINGEDTGLPSKGEDGSKIEIKDGYWYIDGVYTGVSAVGQDGSTPQITIGSNGNWFINGVDTGESAVNLDYYTVTLDLNGGTVEDMMPFQNTYTVREGHTIPELPIPAKEQFEFLGWYTGLDQTSDRFTTTTQVYSDLNLTAVYRSLVEDTYTIKWVNYDGTELEVDSDVLYGTTPTYDGETPTKESDSRYSYEFTNWSPIVEPASKDMVYVAQFKEVPLKFTITYELNGYGELLNPVNEVTYRDALDYPELDKSEVTNLAFDGWYFDTEFNNRVSFPYYPEGNVTLYARWIEISENMFSTYSNNDGTCTIRSFLGNDAEYETIAIPSTINGETVTGIDNAFQNNKQIKNIILPDTMKNINDNAFRNSSLMSINLPTSIVKIGNNAFESCGGLIFDMTTLPNLERVGDYAFNYTNITNFDFTESTKLNYIGEYAFHNTNLQNIDLYNASLLNTLNNSCFSNCRSLISIVLPQSLKTIGSNAFSASYSLTSITLPNTLSTIGYSAFFNCYSLTTLILPTSITTINNNAFEGCTSLTLYCEPTSKPYDWNDNFAGDALAYWYSYYEPTGAGMYWHYVNDEEGNQVPQKW